MRYFIQNSPQGVFFNFQSVIPMAGTCIIGTLADPSIVESGCDIALGFECHTPLGSLDEIVYPGGAVENDGSRWILAPYQLAMNNLLRVKRAHHILSPGAKKDSLLRRLDKSICSYQSALMDLLRGKKGLFSRQIIGARTGNSLRAVAVPSSARSPEWIGVPNRAMKVMGAKDGDLLTTVRYPALWDKSVEVLRIYPVDHDCLAIHPVLCSQMAMDFDGDTASGWCVPVTLRSEAEGFVLEGYKSLEDKAKPYPVAQVNDVSWCSSLSLDAIHEEVVQKLLPTGKSISPEDIITGNVAWYEDITGKDLIEDTQKIASGINLAEVRERVCNVNFANLVTKRFIGPAGSLGASVKTLAIATGDIATQKSAMYVTERLCQSLMDAKHNVGTTDQQEFQRLMDLLHFRGDEAFFMNKENYYASLEACGLDSGKFKPIADLLLTLRSDVTKPFEAGAGAFFDKRHPLIAVSLESDIDLDFCYDAFGALLLGYICRETADPITNSLCAVMD